ncbi:MAG: methyltransferase type 11 [Actinobacteria bacterium HGW-Actinobacteria-4]|nr:MAG: methyltransferase type 11 [Actinobacteria bacterium HGW-Actinobacteria-4]
MGGCVNPAAAPSLDRLEILDVLWRRDPTTGTREPVHTADAAARLRASGQARGARFIESLPQTGGVLDQDALDRVFLGVHYELARLSEYLQVPQRMAAGIAPLIAAVREREGPGPVHVIDVGCGIGLDVRWMASAKIHGPDVEYVGVDLNGLLIEAATRLAAIELVSATFVVGDAFEAVATIAHPDRTVLISQGLLHHVGADRLTEFFSRHHESGLAAFAHFDVNPGFWSTLGGWVLHRVRMREPVSRHDGNLSLRRALDAPALLAHARAGVGDFYSLECADVAAWLPAPHRALRPIVGVRR